MYSRNAPTIVRRVFDTVNMVFWALAIGTVVFLFLHIPQMREARAVAERAAGLGVEGGVRAMNPRQAAVPKVESLDGFEDLAAGFARGGGDDFGLEQRGHRNPPGQDVLAEWVDVGNVTPGADTRENKCVTGVLKAYLTTNL